MRMSLSRCLGLIDNGQLTVAIMTIPVMALHDDFAYYRTLDIDTLFCQLHACKP